MGQTPEDPARRAFMTNFQNLTDAYLNYRALVRRDVSGGMDPNTAARIELGMVENNFPQQGIALRVAMVDPRLRGILDRHAIEQEAKAQTSDEAGRMWPGGPINTMAQHEKREYSEGIETWLRGLSAAESNVVGAAALAL